MLDKFRSVAFTIRFFEFIYDKCPTAGQVARDNRETMSRSTAWRKLQKMDKLGLVHRHTSDDKVVYALTDKGHDYLGAFYDFSI